MSNEFKDMLNRLQVRIDKNSDRMLLIFDNKDELLHYKNLIIMAIQGNAIPKDYLDHMDLVTIDDLLSPNGLNGRRFIQYEFVKR